MLLLQEVKMAKAMEDKKKKKKKRAHVLIRRNKDELHLSNYKGNRHIKVI